MSRQGTISPESYEIMIIDDDPGLLKLLSGILEKNGYQVRTASNGPMGLQFVSERSPDIILLDVKMPQMSGIEVCQRLKSEKHSRNIPIMFISGLDDTTQKVKGFQAGGVDFITKPFQSEEVLARVGTHLKLRELTEHLEKKVAERTTELSQTNKHLRREIQQRRHAEKALQKAHDDLERMVEKRTAELSRKNRQLINEIEEHRKTGQALEESEIKYRTIFEATTSATIIIEKDTTISLANTEFERLSGYTKAQIEGKKKWTAFIVEEDLKMMLDYHNLRRKTPQAVPRNYECRAKNKNGQMIDIFITVAMMPGTDKSVASFLDISRLKQIQKNLRESESRLRYLSSRLLDAQESERQRISLEIHDDLGQNLAVLKLELGSLARKLRKDQGTLKIDVHKMMDFTDNIIAEMRRISRDLSPAIVQDLKLRQALKWMLHDFNQHTGIDISQTMIDIDEMYDSKEQITIYRIFQEALNNIRKHAHADHINVAVGKNGDTLKITIADNGIGYDLDEVRCRHVANRGLGITSLEERSRMLGGDLEIVTAKGKGTCLNITIPMEPNRGES